jgi:hypothetical protein
MAKSSEAYIDEILRLLANGIVERGKVLAKVVKKWQISARTFDRAWKTAQERHLLTQQKLNDKLEATFIQNKTDNLSNGLKTKSERLMNLQRQADDIQRMLDCNITPDIVKSPKQLEYMEIERKLTFVERATLMKSLRDLQSEISKIEGDYAPTKQDVKLDDQRQSTKLKLADGTEIEM